MPSILYHHFYIPTLSSQKSKLTSQQSDIIEIKSILPARQTISQTLAEISIKISSKPSSPHTSYMQPPQPPSPLSPATPTSLYTATSTISSPSSTKISSLTTSSPNCINNPSPIDIDIDFSGFHIGTSSPASTLSLSAMPPSLLGSSLLRPTIATPTSKPSIFPINAHCYSSPSPSISTASTLEPILFNLRYQELFMASPSLSLPSGQFSPPITIFATSDDSIQSCFDNPAICFVLCLLKEHVAPGLFSDLHLSKLSFDAKYETLSPNRCLIITSTHRSISTMSAFTTKYTLTNNKNAFRLLDYYDPNKLQNLPGGTTLTTTLYQTTDNANSNPSPTLAWKLITLPFYDVSEAFSIAFWTAGRIVNRLDLSAANDAPIFVEAAAFFQSFNRAFGLSAIRANFREESFNEVLIRSQWKYEMMFGYMNSHLGPTDHLNSLENFYYSHLQFNSSPIIPHLDPHNESKIYVFDSGGKFNVLSITRP